VEDLEKAYDIMKEESSLSNVQNLGQLIFDNYSSLGFYYQKNSLVYNDSFNQSCSAALGKDYSFTRFLSNLRKAYKRSALAYKSLYQLEREHKEMNIPVDLLDVYLQIQDVSPKKLLTAYVSFFDEKCPPRKSSYIHLYYTYMSSSLLFDFESFLSRIDISSLTLLKHIGVKTFVAVSQELDSLQSIQCKSSSSEILQNKYLSQILSSLSLEEWTDIDSLSKILGTEL